MKPNEFDRLVREKFEGAGLPYKPENWQKLSAVLDEKERSKRRFMLWPLASIAASVAMALGIVTWMSRNDERQQLQARKQQAPVSSPLTEEQPAQTITVPARPALVTAIPAEQKKQQATAPPASYVNQAAGQEPDAVMANKTTGVFFNFEGPSLANTEIKRDLISGFKAEAPDPMPDIRTLSPTTISQTNVSHMQIRLARPERRKYLTMGGGLNYGTLHSGYVMGFTAGTRLNDRWSIEGDVAFVGNIAGKKSSYTFTTEEAANTVAKSATAFVNTTTVTATKYYNFYYAQFTPSISYHAGRNLSIGAGPDVQRLLMGNSLVTEGDNPKKLPVYDLGLVGKADYSLTRDIKASLSYRKAMNQALGGGKMLDRDYLQLQLKFTILNK